jgi:hypothetical protein
MILPEQNDQQAQARRSTTPAEPFAQQARNSQIPTSDPDLQDLLQAAGNSTPIKPAS